MGSTPVCTGHGGEVLQLAHRNLADGSTPRHTRTLTTPARMPQGRWCDRDRANPTARRIDSYEFKRDAIALYRDTESAAISAELGGCEAVPLTA
ncbi:hypothetical protein [[Mycobacterium] burgundiense]|uniref:Uncharacterized protein n=1 Tax=[Mycobacterium] burgundiense TaxID=3064286 RepID=A0ABN9NWE2_9MYCO|nr:hypothetical protein [Mycolicibacterium sp. MU0053]CAJ1511191.1 hypothetical protein MU0053_005108 [Mycolicibacterium sp. MU0053]